MRHTVSYNLSHNSWEGLPVTLLEALYVGGIVDEINDENNGLLSKSCLKFDCYNVMLEF